MTTLQSLLDLLRQRCNMEVNQFVTDAELTTYLNNSLCLLDGLLISKFNDYKLTTVIVSVDVNSNLQLPANFFKLRGVDTVVDMSTPDGYETMHAYQFKKRNHKRFTGFINSFSALEYRLEGSNIHIIPEQVANQYQYRLWYISDYIPLVLTTDTLQPYMDSQAWYEYAIVDSAIKVLEKQDLDTSVFERQAAMLRDHITKVSSPNRDAGEPAAIVDTRHEHSTTGYGWGW